MKKNQAPGNEQRSAASLIVLHAGGAECFLLAGARKVIPIRPFRLGGQEFADVIQFIS